MTLSDFKAIEGDRQLGVASLPVTIGVDRAARLACAMMLVPPLLVVGLLLLNGGTPLRATAILELLIGQKLLVRRPLRNHEKVAPSYNGTSVVLFMADMMIIASAVRAGAV